MKENFENLYSEEKAQDEANFMREKIEKNEAENYTEAEGIVEAQERTSKIEKDEKEILEAVEKTEKELLKAIKNDNIKEFAGIEVEKIYSIQEQFGDRIRGGSKPIWRLPIYAQGLILNNYSNNEKFKKVYQDALKRKERERELQVVSNKILIMASSQLTNEYKKLREAEKMRDKYKRYSNSDYEEDEFYRNIYIKNDNLFEEISLDISKRGMLLCKEISKQFGVDVKHYQRDNVLIDNDYEIKEFLSPEEFNELENFLNGQDYNLALIARDYENLEKVSKNRKSRELTSATHYNGNILPSFVSVFIKKHIKE